MNYTIARMTVYYLAHIIGKPYLFGRMLFMMLTADSISSYKW